MFTGIIEDIGIVESIENKKNLSVLKIRAKKVARGVKAGDSIAVDGVCLTVTALHKNFLTFDVMRETLLKSTLGAFKRNTQVNLERALKMGDRLSGHFVTGHVDCVSRIKDLIKGKNYLELKMDLPKNLLKYVVSKGSVCIDGVSLTVGQVRKNHFSVYLIPFTKITTTLGLKHKGDKVNIETDVLAKYIFNPFQLI